MGDPGSFLTSFWVRASNIPPQGMITDIGFLIGNSIGECMSVDADDQGCCMVTFMRIRVKFDVSHPLRRIAKLNMGPKHPLV